MDNATILLVEACKSRVNSYVRKVVDFNQFLAAARQPGLYWPVLNEALRE